MRRMQLWSMRTGITISVSASDRLRLETIVNDRNAPQKHVWRSRIIILTADGLGTSAIMRAAGKSKTCVWRWQERFFNEGVDGLIRDKTRPPGTAPVAPSRVEKVVALTLTHTARSDPLDGSGHGEDLRACGFDGAENLARPWARAASLAGLQAFERPGVCGKTARFVGLYVSPPAHAVVLSVDEKSQIQALDRTQPGLPLKKGRGGTLTHDYKRHGTTTLFAALNVLDGTVIGQNMQRHRHQEFIRFLNAIEAQVPAGKVIHAVLDNYAAHKHEKVQAWLARHPRWTLHFTPTSCSWLNAVEGFFAKLTKWRLKHGVFCSITDLQAAINRFIEEHNQTPKPFVWKKDPHAIIAAVNRGY